MKIKLIHTGGLISLLIVSTHCFAGTSFSHQVREQVNTRVTLIDKQNSTIELRPSTRKHLEFFITAENGEHWEITLDAPNHEDFHLGTYKRIGEYPIDNQVGMRLIHNSTYRSGQSILIKDLQADAAGNVISAALDFTWEFNDAIYSSFRYQSDVADDVGDYANAASKKSIAIDYQAPAGFVKVHSDRDDDYSARLSMDGTYLRVYSRYTNWNMELTAPAGEMLEVGKYYENTTDSMTHAKDRAGMCISRCNWSRGRFIIREMELNKYYEIKHLAVDFEYPYNNDSMKFGEIHSYGAHRYHSNVAVNVTPISVYDDTTKQLTVPLAVNHVGFPAVHYPVKLVFELTGKKPFQFKLIEITATDLSNFDVIAAPSGLSQDNYGRPKFVITKITSPILFADNKFYEVTFQKVSDKSAELKVGDLFVYHDKIAVK